MRSSDSFRTHSFALTAAVLAAALAVVPFQPVLPAAVATTATSADSSTDSSAAATRSNGPVAPAGRGRVTTRMQAEIDRVVAEGASVDRAARSTPYALARAATRCATFEGQRYCLGVGWTNRSPDEVARRSAGPEPRGRERTGDLSATAALRRTVRLIPRARAREERRELTLAARSVAKVWQLRHEFQGVPLPDDFLDRHPEASPLLGRQTSGRKDAADYPEKTSILRAAHVRAQNRSYWCGPATMQAIGWGWKDRRHNQAMWARRLGTSSAGTAITDMVRVVNGSTGYDRKSHAGPYIALDIADFSFDEWYLLMMRHISDYKAPVVLHPVLLKRWYPYLDDDASGHFQVGRGFDQNPGGNPRIGYFEPWDQSKFDPTEPFIERVQWRSAYKSYRANQAHFQHNVGV